MDGIIEYKVLEHFNQKIFRKGTQFRLEVEEYSQYKVYRLFLDKHKKEICEVYFSVYYLESDNNEFLINDETQLKNKIDEVIYLAIEKLDLYFHKNYSEDLNKKIDKIIDESISLNL